MISREDLLKKYNISEEEYEAADISWEDLEYIYKDFSEKRSRYEEILADFEKEYLVNIYDKGIHSYRTRVKDEEHLIVKIIRKRQENYRKYGKMNKYNYEKFLTDLIGIRCFILFKSDWEKFHCYIDNIIEDNPGRYIHDCLKDFEEDNKLVYMAEGPKVHIRAGDSRSIYEKMLPPDAIKSQKIYRSVHYIVKYQGIYLEIQVRTLFEEGWGEVDHYMVYPYYENDILFQQYTGLLNRLAGLADEMSSFFCEVKRLEVEHLGNQKCPPEVLLSENEKDTEKKTILDGKIPSEKNGNTPADCIYNVLNE